MIISNVLHIFYTILEKSKKYLKTIFGVRLKIVFILKNWITEIRECDGVFNAFL